MKENDKLYILWTNDNKVTFKNMISMYAFNAKKNNWWNEIEIIIWGSSSKLVANNKEVQNHIKKLINSSIKISACRACADELQVTDRLIELGIEVKYWGEPLTNIIKDKENLITF
ncbi:MAG: DsrE family protein [Halanaerobiales bacterium]|nr:DsrE family protein [Halanaerobiales bacterium]